MIEKQLRTDRGTVYYWRSEELHKDHRTLVFLHGLTADHTLFDQQIEYFVADCNVFVWDAPAHGKSRPYSDFTYANAAQDLKAILDENGIEKAVLIGQSMGGYVSQSFILRYPHMAEAFVGIDTCPYGEQYYSRSDKWWLRQIEWMSRLYPLGILKKSVAKQCTCTEYARKNMFEALAPYGKAELCRLMGIGYAGFLVENQNFEELRIPEKNQNLEGARIFEKNRDLDEVPRTEKQNKGKALGFSEVQDFKANPVVAEKSVRKISCPVLLLCGENDRTGKVKKYCEAWTKATGFPLVFIKNAAHNANADNPAAVNSEIAEFLRILSTDATQGHR